MKFPLFFNYLVFPHPNTALHSKYKQNGEPKPPRTFFSDLVFITFPGRVAVHHKNAESLDSAENANVRTSVFGPALVALRENHFGGFAFSNRSGNRYPPQVCAVNEYPPVIRWARKKLSPMNVNKTPHDGQTVKTCLKALSLSDSDFGREMGWDKSKTSRMLKEAAWRTDELRRASEVLGVDLFAAHRQDLSGPVTIMVPFELAPASKLLAQLRKSVLERMETENRPPGKVDG